MGAIHVYPPRGVHVTCGVAEANAVFDLAKGAQCLPALRCPDPAALARPGGGGGGRVAPLGHGILAAHLSHESMHALAQGARAQRAPAGGGGGVGGPASVGWLPADLEARLKGSALGSGPAWQETFHQTRGRLLELMPAAYAAACMKVGHRRGGGGGGGGGGEEEEDAEREEEEEEGDEDEEEGALLAAAGLKQGAGRSNSSLPSPSRARGPGRAHGGGTGAAGALGQ